MFVNKKLIYNYVIKVRKIYSDSFFITSCVLLQTRLWKLRKSLCFYRCIYLFYFHDILLLLLAQTSYKTKGKTTWPVISFYSKSHTCLKANVQTRKRSSQRWRGGSAAGKFHMQSFLFVCECKRSCDEILMLPSKLSCKSSPFFQAFHL